jgi:hypothetical protein
MMPRGVNLTIALWYFLTDARVRSKRDKRLVFKNLSSCQIGFLVVTPQLFLYSDHFCGRLASGSGRLALG